MKKKNLKNRGGQSMVEDVFHNYGVKQGPYITDDIKRNIELGKEKYLNKKYKNINTDAEKQYNIARGQYNEIEDYLDKENNRLFKYRKLNSEKFFKTMGVVGGIFKGLGNATASLGNGLYNTVTSLGKGLGNTANIGKGVIIKTIVLLILIGLLIGALVWFFKSNDPNKTFDYSSDNTSMFFFQSSGAKTSLFTDMFNKINNIIPDKYKINFNIFKNNVNKFFGNDFSGTNRETISEGRYDGINHIKFNNEDKIISMMKPNDIKWNVKFDNYPNIDFNKLPEDVKKQIYDENRDEGFTITANGKQIGNDSGSIFIYEMTDNKNSPFDNSKTKANFYELKDKNINPNKYKYSDVPIDFEYNKEKGTFEYPNFQDIDEKTISKKENEPNLFKPNIKFKK